jgi:hypothetical protein
MTTPFHPKNSKRFFSPSYISYLCYASEKSMIKLLNFLQHGFQGVKFPEKGLSTMAAIWPSTETVNMTFPRSWSLCYTCSDNRSRNAHSTIITITSIEKLFRYNCKSRHLILVFHWLSHSWHFLIYAY